jgi:hypothetical protein
MAALKPGVEQPKLTLPEAREMSRAILEGWAKEVV